MLAKRASNKLVPLILGTLLAAMVAYTQTDPEELRAASRVADEFLQGIKILELAEGKKLLEETQWIVGAADYGQNFYTRPQFTEARILFDNFFETGIQIGRVLILNARRL